MSSRTRHPSATPYSHFLLCALLFGSYCGTLLANDPLSRIHADTPAVILCPNLRQSLADINGFVKKIAADRPGLTIADIEARFALPPDLFDPSKPVAIIIPRADFDLFGGPVRDIAVIAFTPSDPGVFRESVHDRDHSIRRITLGEKTYFTMMRKGVAFLAADRRTLRAVRRPAPGRSLADALDPAESELAARSDVFIRIPMTPWKDRIAPLYLLASNLFQMGIAAQPSKSPEEAEQLKSVIDWFIQGGRLVLEQIRTASFAVDLDSETFRLVHRTDFLDGTHTAKHLSAVKASTDDPLKDLPNQPFFLLNTLNWNGPARDSVSYRFYEFVLSLDSVRAEITEDARKKLLEATLICQEQQSCSSFMFTSQPDCDTPFQIIGAYRVKDSDLTARHFIYLQENCAAAMSSLMPGGFFGKFQPREIDGFKFHEMAFNFDKMDSATRAETRILYGADARIQEAALDPHRFVYLVCDQPDALVRLAKQKTDQTMADHPGVARILQRLPENPNLLCILDIGRLIRALPVITAEALPPGMPSPFPMNDDGSSTRESGPLIAWACKTGPSQLTGQLVIDVQDAARAIHLLQEMGDRAKDQIAKDDAPAPAPGSALGADKNK